MIKQLLLVFALAAQHAHAHEFYCTGTKGKVDRFALVQAYSGQPVLIGRAWVTACMMPAHTSSSRAVFSQLIGVSAETSEQLSRKGNLIDRGIRVVRDEIGMEVCLTDNAPAVGYFLFRPLAKEIEPCF